MDTTTFLRLFIICGVSTLSGFVPILFRRYLKDTHTSFWESFGGGVMLSASIFSLFLPSWKMSTDEGQFLEGVLWGFIFIALSSFVISKFSFSLKRKRAYIFVFVMAVHNIPEGLSVGVDVAALGWKESLPLSVAIFLQNIPEGFASSLSFLLAGFSLHMAFAANAVTALIETLSSYAGFGFTRAADLSIAKLLAFAGASMSTVVAHELVARWKSGEKISFSGFTAGLVVCALLDLFL